MKLLQNEEGKKVMQIWNKILKEVIELVTVKQYILRHIQDIIEAKKMILKIDKLTICL